MGFTYTFVSICGDRFSNWIPRNGSIPLHSVSIVNLTEECALLSVSKKLDAVSILGMPSIETASNFLDTLDRAHRLSSSCFNSSRQNRFKCCNLHDLSYIFLDNGVMNTPKRRFLSFAFTVLSFTLSKINRKSSEIDFNAKRA